MIADLLTSSLTQTLWVFMAILARISPVLMLSPPTRSSGVPARVRAGVAIAMAALLTPVARRHSAPMPGDLINLLICLVAEVLLGLVIGSVVLLAVSALQLAGQAIGHLAGFDVAEAMDPSTEENMSILASIMGWLAMGVLLTLGGHREVIDCCLESCTVYPTGAVTPDEAWLQKLDDLMQHTLRVGIRAAAPVGTALLMANLLTALIARTLPQLSVLAVGFNINAFVMLLLLILSVSGWLGCFKSN